mgnify:CR=1 FL=1
MVGKLKMTEQEKQQLREGEGDNKNGFNLIWYRKK